MRNESRGRRGCAVAAGAVMIVLSACGSNSNVAVNSPGGCDGGTGPHITGAIQMPNGKVAQADTWRARLSSAVWSAAAAINGDVSPVRAGVPVELVELRQDDVLAGREPGVVEIGLTRKNGQFCIGLPAGTDENICRFVVQVGDSASHTLTRAFVFSSTDPIDIDFRSEATVRVILAKIPPAGLCDFSPGDIRNVYDAVANAPGTANGAAVDELNAVAATLAAADPGVQAAVATGAIPPPPPTPTRLPATPTSVSAATDTPGRSSRTPAPQNTATPPIATRTAPIATRTAVPGTPSALPTRTPTPGPSGTPTNRPPTRTRTPG